MRRLPFIFAALFFALAGLIGPNHKHTAQASSAFYGFEDGTVQGWTHSGSATTVANSTTHAQEGSHSLRVSLSGTSNSRTGFAYVNPGSGIIAGDQLQAYVYLPRGSATLQAGIYVQDQAYKQTSANYVTLTAGQWTKLVYVVPSTAELALRQFGVQFTAPSRFTGSAFVDAAGVVTPPTNTSTATPTPTNTATPTPTNTPAATATATPGTVTVFRGVNLSGAEFGSNLPGAYGVDYTMPTTTELDYFHSKGLNLIRLPLKWERLQNAANGPLSSNDSGLLDHFISDAHARGMYVIIDVHNYGRYYGNVIGTSAVPISAYADLWSKLAAHYKGMPGIWGYNIMNEPHDMNGVWPQAAQAAVNAIRQQDTQTRILVEGDGWASAYYWQKKNGSLNISDPNNNLIYAAHQYFDHDGSGTYSGTYDQEGAYPVVGVDRTKPFIDWLRANGHQGMIGEYGVPGNDSRWLTVLDNFLGYLDQNRDLGLSGTDWAAGPWWGNYLLSVEPNADGSDKSQIPILTAHLGG